jgi:hypothetical protein
MDGTCYGICGCDGPYIYPQRVPDMRNMIHYPEGRCQKCGGDALREFFYAYGLPNDLVKLH